MLFNSLDFAVFLPVVFLLYWYVCQKSYKAQNFLIVIASYVFYGWWDYRFLSLILFSSVVDYTIGLRLRTEDRQARRKLLLWLSILVNLGFLGYFKYANFFIENFTTAFSFLGKPIQPNTLDIILPVGISFYTFQTLSYTIDVYRRKLEPTRDFIAFSAFVSFFPQLVAGPIERATHLLPQFSKPRVFDYGLAMNGVRQIIWGMFKKVVVADNCAMVANEMFNNSDQYAGMPLLIGALFFTFQIYGDFSGYSDIAIGVSRLFGFDLMRNFAYPYFSRDIAEFWRRWHISLSTWFRDYLYIPLGGSKGGTALKVRNTFIIFIVSGFWHGANWTFIVWGALNAAYFLPLLLTKRNRTHIDIIAHDRALPTMKELRGVVITFGLTVIAWIFFRADSLGHAFSYLAGIFDAPGSYLKLQWYLKYNTILTAIIILLLVEWFGRNDAYGLEQVGRNWPKPVRWSFYYTIVIITFLFSGQQQEFVYFQF